MNDINREAQIAMLATQKKQIVVQLIDQLCQQLEITETQYQKAKAGYEAVGSWLSESSIHHLARAQIYPTRLHRSRHRS